MKLNELIQLTEGRKHDSFDDIEPIKYDLRRRFSDGKEPEYHASHSDSPAGLLDSNWKLFSVLRNLAHPEGKGVFRSKEQAEGILSYFKNGKLDFEISGSPGDSTPRKPDDVGDVHVEADARGIINMTVTHRSDGKVDQYFNRASKQLTPRDLHYDDDHSEAQWTAKDAREAIQAIETYSDSVAKHTAEIANLERQLQKKAAAGSTDEKQARIAGELQKKLERAKYYLERSNSGLAEKKKEYASLKRKIDKYRKGP